MASSSDDKANAGPAASPPASPAAGAAADTAGKMPMAWTGLTGLVALMIPVCLYLIFVFAPVERELGIVQKIFYFHVPSAFSMYLACLVSGIASAVYLFRRTDKWDAIAVAAAEVAVLFGTIVLTTGPIWARKSWGIWWAWDPRLTATLLTWLIFVSYLALRSFGAAGQAEKRIAAALATFGILLIPVIRYATQKFGGEHPVLGELDDDMRVAYNVCALTMLSLCASLIWFRTRIERTRQRIWLMNERAAEEGLLEDQ